MKTRTRCRTHAWGEVSWGKARCTVCGHRTPVEVLERMAKGRQTQAHIRAIRAHQASTPTPEVK